MALARPLVAGLLTSRRAWSSRPPGDAAAAAVAAAWARVAAAGRPGLAEAEALLEDAIRPRFTDPASASTAALHDALATVAFLRGGRPAVAEAAAKAAVAAAGAAGAAPAALALCRARHAACLVSLGRYGNAVAVLDAVGPPDPTPEAGFFRTLAQVAAEAGGGGGGGGGGRGANQAAAALPAALVAAVVTQPPPPTIAPLLEAAALRELRRAADAAVQAGEWAAALALAQSECDAHDALTAARVGGGPPDPPSSASLHAQYRLATLLHALGDARAVPAAEAALDAATAAWGADDDRTVLRAHRAAAARAAVLADGGAGGDTDRAADVAASATRALDRFRRRLGAGAGLAGEAAAAAAAAKLVALGAGGGADEAAAAAAAGDPFTAVLAPRRRRAAASELRAGLVVMRSAYGPDHVLTKRAERMAAALLETGGEA